MDSLILFVISIVVAFMVGMASESSRLYDKCLQEHQDLPLTKAVQICKDRVK